MFHATSRNLVVLTICQCVATGGTVLVVTVGGIVGSALAPSPTLATVPMSLMVVGTAFAAVPAALLMRRIGRRWGFAVSAVGASLASLTGAVALWVESFVLFSVSTALIGAKLAFVQQYRFAAAESTRPDLAGRAVSLVLLGSVGGALAGPALATGSYPGIAVPFAGSFLVLAGLFLLAALLLLLLHNPPAAGTTGSAAGSRPLRALLRRPLFVIAVLGGVVGQGVMTFVMTATPISMHVLDGFSLADTAAVIRAHVLAMYLPSLASALLIGRLGSAWLMALGLAALFITVVVAMQGHAYVHYWYALLVLGIGWNFLFVGGTSLLVQSYLPEERFTAQAANDFAVFGTAAYRNPIWASVTPRSALMSSARIDRMLRSMKLNMYTTTSTAST